MKLVVGLLLLVFLTANSSAAVCNYYRYSNRITCGSVSCSTPPLLVGAESFHPDITISGLSGRDQVGWRTTPWFNLYKLKQNADGSGYWDYYTKIPKESCRGGFALHPGGTSL